MTSSVLAVKKTGSGFSGVSSGPLPLRMLSVLVLMVTVSLNVPSSVALETRQRFSSPIGIVNNVNVASPNNFESPIIVQEENQSWNVAEPHIATINAHRVDTHSQKTESKTVPAWDYARHGADWTSGMCKIGSMQSPVDLHVDGLVSRRPENLKQVFESVLKGDTTVNTLSDGWKRGDIVYSYRHLISSVQVMRTDKVFRLSIPANEGSTFGALFTTDRPNLYMATHIEFHSPSEHTFEGSANRRQVEVQIWHYYGDDSGADSGIRSLELNEHTDMNVLVSTHDADMINRVNKVGAQRMDAESKLSSKKAEESHKSEEPAAKNDKSNEVDDSKSKSDEGDKTSSHDQADKTPHVDHFADSHQNDKPVADDVTKDVHSETYVQPSTSDKPGEHGTAEVSSASDKSTPPVVNESQSEGADTKKEEKSPYVIVDIDGNKIGQNKPSGSASATNNTRGHSEDVKSATKSVAVAEKHEEHKDSDPDDYEDIDDEEDDEVDDGEDIKDANFVNDEAGASFIEVLSDVEMADGHHVINPNFANTKPHDAVVHSVRNGSYRGNLHQEQNNTPLAISDKAENISDMHAQSTGEKLTDKHADAAKPADSADGKKKNDGTGHESHPLKSEHSKVYSDMVESEQFELLHKYLLDHLHKAAYDKEGDRRHVSEKRRARETGVHWGRWAVLSMTFMSEEMERTRIETLKSFPSERFMEQVLSVGSEVDVSADPNSSGVGDLGADNGSELPVVELDVPINLSSLLMMLETKNLNYFAYDGSFTRPGCEETVRWYVAKESLPVSTELMLQIHRMLNQTRDQTAHSAPINKYRELQNVNSNLHNSGKVHLVHAYPMEYFIAASLDHARQTPVHHESGFYTCSFGLWAIIAAVTLMYL
ncbi:membrane protein, putative [Babesia bigemina]|uniref:Membrane protein, putative n=1 Tax=Babesia bigemina TaxID=5866 RepID=A0A061DD10_BABBI|nr:membrane protein, putative [Babesia bigemina]CDR97019.1 membrane protein, putative [Babesia bigemina]|eukprot:XP_012769205.1 membrane protein, putative [Babesia bigemina]